MAFRSTQSKISQVKCPYSQYGCMAKLQFTDLDDHMTNPFSIAEHLQLMVRRLTKLENRNRDLACQVESLQKAQQEGYAREQVMLRALLVLKRDVQQLQDTPFSANETNSAGFSPNANSTESDLQRAYTAPKSSATGNNGSYWWLQNTPESTSVEASSAQLLQTPGAKTSTAIDTPQPHPSKTPSPPPIQESLSVSALKEDRQNRQSPLLDVPRHNDIPRHDVTSRDTALRDSAEPTQPVQPDAHHESAPASEAAGDPEAEGEAGKLPEVPRMFVAPEHITEMAEVAEGARVKATRADGKGDERGTVRYKGELGGGQQVWVGVHFDRPVGDCAGIWGEREYFRCPPQHGCFLPTQFVRPLSVVEAREEAEEKEKGSAALGRDNDPDSTATLSVDESQNVEQNKMPGMFFERALELALKHTGGTAEDLLLPENAEALVANASAYVELWGAFEKGLHEGGARRLEDAASLSRALEAAGLGAEEGGSAWRSIAQDNGVAFEAFAAHVQGRRKSAGQTDAEVGVATFDYNGRAGDELTFRKGQKIECLERHDDGWALGSVGGQRGVFPLAYTDLQ